MAQEQTVQGAAKKISGLLNPDKGQSAPEKKAEPSEQPEKIEQETSPESQPKSEGTPNEGQKQSLRQTYDNRLSELNDMISTADGYIRQQQGSKDLQKLYDEDPTSAARLDYQLREQQKQIDGMKSKANEAYTKQYNEYLDAEKQLAAAKIPEFSDPNKSDHFKTNMRTTLRGYGFNDGEIGNLADHRFLMVIKDAMSYKSQVDKKPIAQKKVANAPKVVKSGVARSNVSSGRESIRNKIGTLKKTGHLKDAQNALMDMINLKSQQQRK